VISASTATTETSACWAVATNNGRFVFVANTGSASLSGYAVTQGALSLLDPDGKSAVTGAGPGDLAITQNSQNLYALNGAAHTITSFGVSQSTGTLSVAAAPLTVPTGVVGLAAK
jgi:6-phosphogluconolactonase (cycloisomerase 2 family)